MAGFISLIVASKIGDLEHADGLIIAATVVLAASLFVFPGGLEGARLRPNLLDLSACAVVLTEALGFLTSTYRANSFHNLAHALSLFVFYYLVRVFVCGGGRRLLVYGCLSLFGLWLSGALIYSFYFQFRAMTSLGFEDVTNLRHLFRLNNLDGSPNGEWATLFMVLPAFPLALFFGLRRGGRARWLALVPAAACVVAALLSFSRGIYLGVFVALAGAGLLCRLYGVCPRRRLLAAAGLTLLLVAAGALPFRRPVLTTLMLFETTSQVRSLSGRARLWERGGEMFKAAPLFGVGAHNFSIHYVSHKSEEEDTVFAGRPLNYFLQLLIEKGVVGLLAYCLLGVSFFVLSFRLMRRPVGRFEKGVVLLFAAVYAGALVRDLSYSSILSSKGVSTVLWFMFAHNACLYQSAAAPAPAGD